MTLLEPEMLAGLAAVPFIWLLARNASRPRMYPVGSLRLWREVQKSVGTSRRARRFDAWLLTAIAVVVVGSVGAAGPGEVAAESDGSRFVSEDSAPLIGSAKIEAGWLHCRSNEEVWSWELRSANPAISMVFGYRGADDPRSMLMRLPEWESEGHLVLFADRREALYLYAEPLVYLRGDLPAATREALESVLVGVKWDAERSNAISVGAKPPAPGSRGVVFGTSDSAAAGSDLPHDAVAVAAGWEALLSYPDLVQLARPLAPKLTSSRRPLLWFNRAEEQFPAIEIDDRSGVVHIHLGNDASLERHPWYPVLIGLSIRELTGHDVFDRDRYTMHRSPATRDQPLVGDDQHGIYPSGVRNHIGVARPTPSAPPTNVRFDPSIMRFMSLALAWAAVLGLVLASYPSRVPLPNPTSV